MLGSGVRAALVAVVAVPLWAWTATRPPAAPSPTAADARDVYLRDCAVCHGDAGEGSDRGPAITGAGEASVDYYLTTGRMPLGEPDEEPERSPPSYSPEMIAALVAYVASLGPGGEPIPELDLAAADVARGGELYRLNCAACHHMIGSGGALLHREAPPLRQATPIQTAEAIRVGPGNMPAFGAAAISDQELADVVAYVQVLRDPEDEGGLPLWHLGPVPEGALAVFVGLLPLVLLATWIERRSRART